jgi:hypothetical protein
MAEAKGSLSLDVSKFVSAIEDAKNKLMGLRGALEQSSMVAKAGFKVWDTANTIASSINNITDQITKMGDAYNTVRGLASKVPNALKAIQSAGATASRALATMSPALRSVAVGGAAVGIAIFGAVKAFQMVAGAGKAVIGAIGSIIAKMGELAGKAKDAAVNVAKVVGKGVDAGFKAIGNVAKVAGAGILAVGTAALAAGGFIANGVKGVFDMGDELKTLRDRTGASIPFIMDLQKQFKGVGLSGDAVGPMLNTMQRSLTGVNSEGEPTNKMFERLGLKTEELSKMTPDEAFKKIGSTIANLKTPAERTAASLGIFGKAGGAMTAVFADENFGKIGTNLTGSARVMAENADTFAAISIQLKQSGAMFKDFFVQIAGKVGGPLLAIMNAFQGGDFLAGVGEKIGTVLGNGLTILANAIQQGKIFELLQVGFEASIMFGADFLARAFSAGIETLIEEWKTGLVKDGIQALITGFASATQVMYGYLMKIFQTPIIYFQAGIQTAIEKLLEGLGNIPFLGDKLGLKDFKASSFGENAESIKAQGGLGFGTEGKSADTMIEEGKKGFIDSFTRLGSDVGKVGEIFQQKLSQQSEVISGTTDKMKELKNLTGTLVTPIAKTESKAGQVIADGTDLGGPAGAKSKGGQEAISSLQKIGGGGGAFAGDPMLRNSDKQVKLQEEANAMWKQVIDKSNPRGSDGRLEPKLT